MKISSVSKKVLASALSAAMVVAFAPTVAFGVEAGDKVTVEVDLDGGKTSYNVTFANATEGMTIDLPALSTVVKGTSAATKWTVNGTDAAADADGSRAGYQLKLSGAGDGVYKIKAVYANAADGAAQFGYVSTTPYIQLNVNSNVSNLSNTATLSMKFTNPAGETVAEWKDLSKTENSGPRFIYRNLFFGTGTDAADCKYVDPEFLVGGTWVASFYEGDDLVVEKKVKVVELDVVDATGATETDGGKIFAAEGAFSSLSGASYVSTDGVAFDTTAANALKAGVYTIKKVDAAKQVSVAGGTYGATARTLTYTINDTAAASSAVDKTYEITLVDPSGAVVYSATQDAAILNTTPLKLTFKQGTTVAAINGTEAAGDYILTYAAKDKYGDTIRSGKGKITLTQVVYEAGEGTSFLSSVKAEQKSVFASAVPTPVAVNSLVEAESGYTLYATSWQLNGKDISATNALKAGQVNTLTSKATAVDTTHMAATPVLDSAEYNTTTKQYTVKVSCPTAGVQLFYGNATNPTTPYPATTGIEADGSDIFVVAQPINGAAPAGITQKSAELKLTTKTTDWTALVASTAPVSKKVGKSTAKWSEGAGVKAAIEAGNAAVDGIGYKDAKEMAALLTSNAKALYEAVDAEAKAQLAAYANDALVIVGDKVYTISAKNLKVATDAVAKIESDLGKLKAAELTAAAYGNAVKALIAETNAALNGAVENTTYKAADIQAAQGVTAQLKAAQTAAEAEAAIKAFEALTADQQKLVAAVDVAAAQEIVAAAELIDAQDEGTLNKINSTKKLTVKLGTGKTKTSKAKSLTYTTKVSKSGNAVVYAKASGSSKITVSAAGKVTLKKGAVKGKTYTAKVEATCGNMTRTVTAKFVIK